MQHHESVIGIIVRVPQYLLIKGTIVCILKLSVIEEDKVVLICNGEGWIGSCSTACIGLPDHPIQQILSVIIHKLEICVIMAELQACILTDRGVAVGYPHDLPYVLVKQAGGVGIIGYSKCQQRKVIRRGIII